MNDKQRSSPLGRGLSALFGDQDSSYKTGGSIGGNADARQPRQVPVEFLFPSSLQPRRHFDEEQLRALADSISERGVLQPILVRRHPANSDAFEIVAGERRWRASQMAGLHEVPVVVRDLDDRETLEIAIIENVQRQDLNPVEEALSYKRLMDEFSHTQEAIAKIIGKSRSHIANMLRLLNLPEAVRAMIQKGEITMGHARALLSVEDPAAVARDIVAKGLTVRQIERLGQARHEKENVSKGGKLPKNAGAHGATSSMSKMPDDGVDVDTLALEREVTSWLGLKVQIRQKPQGTGMLSIEYQSLDQLEDVLQRLAVTPKGLKAAVA